MLPRFIFQARENLVEKPWGGEWIALLKGFRGRIGESWEFSAHPSNPSEVIVNGKSISLVELFSKHKKEILGDLAEKYDYFPILVKLIDVKERLSVQVHPSNRVAEALGESDRGKDEAWMCMSDGKVYVGFSRDVSPEELEEIVKENPEDVLGLMNEFDARMYDTFTIRAGTIHCAEGVRLVEVSTNSNVTYRVADFSGRVEQLDKAKKALNFKKSEEYEVRGERGKVEMEKFCMELVEVSGSAEFEIDTFNILVGVEGFSLLKSGGETAELHKGYSCLIPAAAGQYSIISDVAKVVRIYPR